MARREARIYDDASMSHQLFTVGCFHIATMVYRIAVGDGSMRLRYTKVNIAAHVVIRRFCYC